jgi:hypothetical protein
MSGCRRCSECDGATHHWIDNDEAYGEEDPSHACKHCDATGDECETCGGDGERISPDGHNLGLCLACDGYGVVECRTRTEGTR